MKVFLIILSVIAVIILGIQIISIMSQRNIEQYPYKLEEQFKHFEVRSYETSLFTSVTLPTNSYDQASSNGFSMLGGYIFGNNEKNEKIAMTSPVSMSLEDSMTMKFLVPKGYNKNSLPRPNQSNISFVEEPAKTVAVIKFGGWANTKRIAKYKQRLLELVESENMPHTGKFEFLGYNPPYEILNRKNEVILELEYSVDKL